jgi:RNA recognition motif-containing protein
MSLNAQPPVTPPRPRRKSTESSSTDSPPQVADAGANLFVFHLPSDVSDTQLYALFSQFGAIESIKVITDSETGESKGYGFVKYYSMGDAIRAIEAMNGYQIGRKHLKVSFKTSGTVPPPQVEKKRSEELIVTNQNFPALKQPVRIVTKKKKHPHSPPKNGSYSPNSSLTGGSTTGNPIPILKKRDLNPNTQEKQN